MSNFRFVLKNLVRKKLRVFLTFFSLVIAFLLFMVLGSVAVIFTVDTGLVGADRLQVSAKYSIIDDLPRKYQQEIAALDGVELVTHATWFGGFFQVPENNFPTFPIEPVSYFEMFKNDLEISAEHLEVFLNTRIGFLAPVALLEQYGWQIGDNIPIGSSIYPKKDGTMTWEMQLVGTYMAKEDANFNPILFRYEYFDEEVGFGNGRIGWLYVQITDPDRAQEISEAIDEMYINSNDPTRSAPEDVAAAEWLNQLGNIGLMMSGILSAVFFTILLLTANTMSQAFRERIPELAVLKTIGFTDFKLSAFVILEAVLLCVIPAIVGMLMAWFFVRSGFISQFGPFFPPIPMNVVNGTFGAGLVVAVALGLLIGFIPALTAKRLSIVDALQHH